MTIVLVHGNPETDALWGPLVDALGRDDVVLLSPPGFGVPLPEGFSATYVAYRDWLEEQLEGIDGPIDLVGHDFGGIHVVNAMMHRPELVRSWVSDVVGMFDPDYVWHDLAQVWQTPGAGEELIETMLGGTVEERAAAYALGGMPIEVGTKISAGQDPDLGRASCWFTGPRHSQSWRRPGAIWRTRRLDRDCPCSPPRTPMSAPPKSAVVPPIGPAHAPRSWRDSGTGGWWRTLPGVRRS